jgi:hypothetical protein
MEPKRPPGPAFEQARDPDEHRRQQLTVALTPAQRQAFDQLRQQQALESKELREQQRREAPEKLAARMRAHLIPDKQPHLRPEAHKHQLKDRQELSHAARDFVDGKQTRVTQKYEQELRQAHGKAEREVAAGHRQERDRQQDSQQRARDDFLKQAQKDRAQEKTQKDFEKAARDPSWQRAFNRAAQKEAAHEQEIERDDPGKSR